MRARKTILTCLAAGILVFPAACGDDDSTSPATGDDKSEMTDDSGTMDDDDGEMTDDSGTMDDDDGEMTDDSSSTTG